MTSEMYRQPLEIIFLSGFSFTDTGNSQNSKGREETNLTILYHLHSLTNIEVFICVYTSEMSALYF